MKGIDVSGHQGSIAWKEVKKAGYRFAICKATEGQDWKDSTFTKGRRNAIRNQGLIFGAYHFARPSKDFRDARREAQDFVNAAKAAGWNPKTDLPLVLDIEDTKLSGKSTVIWCEAFAGYVKEKTGRGVILYTGSWFWVDKLGLKRAPKNATLLWFAAYTSPSTMKRLIARMLGFKPVLWQYTSSGKVPGVRGNCDVNTTLISDKAFRGLIHS